MLKIRIIAAIFAIVMTIATAYLLPIVYGTYMDWMASLSAPQKQWLNLGQMAIGAVIALVGFLQWKRNKAARKK